MIERIKGSESDVVREEIKEKYRIYDATEPTLLERDIEIESNGGQEDDGGKRLSCMSV